MIGFTALKEFGDGFRDFHAWTLLAWDDVQGRYRRTALGPLWLTLSHGIFVLGLGISFSVILDQPLEDYFVYLAAGMTVWIFISTSLIEGPAIFMRGHSLLFSYDLPASIHIFRAVLGQLIMFAHHMLVYVAALILVKNTLTWESLLAIPGLMVLTSAAVGWSTLLAMLGARYRDLAPAVAAITQMMFMLTPIFWDRVHLQDAAWFALFNPAYHLVEVVRAPLLGRAPEPMTWAVSLAAAALLLAAAGALYALKRRNLSYWL